MPLGGLFGGSSNGPKPQPLQNENKKEKREKGSTSSSKDFDKDCKGMSLKINKKTYTIERKLGEGGFAIVFLVVDKHNRYYAMKRQLIRDDPRQLEACKVEAQIVKNLSGHKNLISYIDQQLTLDKQGVYDSILLTVYYKNSVLQLMNSRVLSNKWLTVNEILDIFCDMCEAVARLHHSRTPVYHRDLKLENILIEQRPDCERPTYVLCDFGSATTKVLSRESHSVEQMESEIKRYTTLSYRAPEMVDLFNDVPIGTKSDIWALGVMLFKLCYFSLPFGESPLAIQNGNFTFPNNPPIPEEIKAIISFLLTPSALHRPNIFQTSYLAFSAANKKCPVFNIHKSPRIELLEAVKIFRMRDKLGANYAKALEKAMNEAYFNTLGVKNTTEPPKTDIEVLPKSELKITTQESATAQGYSNNPFLQDGMDEPLSADSTFIITNTSGLPPTTTTVNPRSRPKPAVKMNMNQPLASSFAVPLLVSTTQPRTTTTAVTDSQHVSSNSSVQPQWQPLVNHAAERSTVSLKSPYTSNDASDQLRKIAPYGADSSIKSGIPMALNTQASSLQHIGPRSSAFKPYSSTSRSQQNQLEKLQPVVNSNPFIDSPSVHAESPSIMDDQVFGEKFDELPRVVTAASKKKESFQHNSIIVQLILNDEPFAKAPFNFEQMYESKRV